MQVRCEAHRVSGFEAGLAEVVAAGRGQRVHQDALAQRARELPQRPLLLRCLRRRPQSHTASLNGQSRHGSTECQAFQK